MKATDTVSTLSRLMVESFYVLKEQIPFSVDDVASLYT